VTGLTCPAYGGHHDINFVIQNQLGSNVRALVGSLAVSTNFSLRGSFFPGFFDKDSPCLLISSMASSSAHGEASPNEAMGPVDGFGCPIRIKSRFSAALATVLSPPVRATAAPACRLLHKFSSTDLLV